MDRFAFFEDVMKNKLYLAATLLIFLGGCKKLDQLTQFNMEYDQEVVIRSSSGINLPFDIFTPDIESNAESTFAVNDTRKDLVEQIILTDLSLSLIEPTDRDLSFLKSVSIYLNAEGLDEVEVASEENIPDSVGKELQITTSGADLQEYLKKDQFSLRLKVVTDKVITTDYRIGVKSIFFVDAKILGN